MRHIKFRLTTLVCGLLLSSSVFAIGFGDPQVRSYLGQALNVQVPIAGVPQEDLNSSCIQGTVKTIGGDFIASPHAEFTAAKRIERNELNNAPALVRFTTRQEIAEPAITLSVTVKCGAAMERNFSLLLDHADMVVPAAIVAAEDSRSARDGAATVASAQPMQEYSAPVVTKKATTKRHPRTKQAKGSNKVATKNTTKALDEVTQEPVAAVKPRESITPKPVDRTPSPPKDELKISNEAIAQTNSVAPPAAKAETKVEAKQETKPIDIEQQRLQENSVAEEHFATMLRDEPALTAEQIVQQRNEQAQRVQQLELEIQRLKLQMQSNIKPIEQNQQAPYPIAMIVVNGVVLVVLIVLLVVVGRLWLALRKVSQAGQPHSNHWWHSSTDNQQVPMRTEGILASAKENKEVKTETPVARPRVETSKHRTAEKAVDEPAAFAPIPEQPHVDARATSATEDNTLGNEDGGNSMFNMFTNRRGQSIQIEELSDCTQEAEFWVSLDNPKRAIEILEPQSLDESSAMPVTLLYLLDLYKKVGDGEKYNQLSARVQHRFNVHIADFNEPVDQSTVKYLEDYEHITSRCCAFWNTNYILPYLESLLIDDREGGRIGFDLSVYRDILFLIAICKELDRTKNSTIAPN